MKTNFRQNNLKAEGGELFCLLLLLYVCVERRLIRPDNLHALNKGRRFQPIK